MTDKNTDEAKGRIKEAAGAVTGDSSLKQEGQADQAKHDVKDVADKAAGKVSDVVDAVTGDSHR